MTMRLGFFVALRMTRRTHSKCLYHVILNEVKNPYDKEKGGILRCTQNDKAVEILRYTQNDKEKTE